LVFQETDFLPDDYLIGFRVGVLVLNCLAVNTLVVLELLVLFNSQAITSSVTHVVNDVLTIHSVRVK
jgi:hypothetical protein